MVSTKSWVVTKSRFIYKLSTRYPPQTYGPIQVESDEMEKDAICEWK